MTLSKSEEAQVKAIWEDTEKREAISKAFTLACGVSNETITVKNLLGIFNIMYGIGHYKEEEKKKEGNKHIV